MGATILASTVLSSTVTTIECRDVRKVWRFVRTELTGICAQLATASRDFDVAGVIDDCERLALGEVITAVRVQIYVRDELVREYAYVVAAEPLPSSGPAAERPPLGHVPDRARVRVVADPNPEMPKEERDAALRALGWVDAKPLRVPSGLTAQQYGTFASGGYAVRRELLANPKYDRPVRPAAPGTPHTTKGR